MNHVRTWKKTRTKFAWLLYSFGALLAIALLLAPKPLWAGLYDADSPMTYKEYWVDHAQFTGGNEEAQLPDCVDTKPSGGEFYIEPWGSCTKTVTFTIPDDFSNALKAELFLDLWRAHDEHAVRYQLNDGQWRAPNAGTDWGRSPYVVAIDKGELLAGTNTLIFKTDGSMRKYHIHDIAVRIYYDAGHPLISVGGSDVVPPDGQLLSIQDDSNTVNADAGGTLFVDNDQLIFSALITETQLSHVEFHAYYEGYDLDNDGVFREWQSRNRHSCNPGTSNPTCTGNAAHPPIGGTIDHIGSTGPSGTFSNCSWNNSTKVASCTWNLAHVTNQAGVRFKIRIIDTNGNVAEAAGGVSSEFKLVRHSPTAAAIVPGFINQGLHLGGLPNAADTYSTTIELPSTVNSFDTFYLLGSYYQNPKIYFNDRLYRPFTQGSSAPVDDVWTLSVKQLNSSNVYPGTNVIEYLYTLWGVFIEEPGPMVVLRRTDPSGFSDSAAPIAAGFEPADGAINVDHFQPVVAYLSDGLGVGVDLTSLQMKIDGSPVTAQITGFSDRYKLTYRKPGGFLHSSAYTVTIEAKDLLNNVMAPASFSFRIEDPDVTPPVISNTQIITSFTQAIITWETDEPATSKISFGTTTTYTGTVEATDYVTSHRLIIPNLQDDTTYHFAITSVDSDNNNATTGDAIFTTPLHIPMVTDDFNYCALDPMWEFVNPKGDGSYQLNGRELILSVAGGLEHDIWSNGTPIIRAPHILQAATDPNLMVVKFSSTFSQAIQQQGILAIQDANNFLRVNFQSIDGGIQVFVVRVRNGTAKTLKSMTVTGADLNTPLYLLLLRDNEQRWWPRYSIDGTNWTNITRFSEAFAITKVGVYAGNAGSNGDPIPPFEAVIDYFSNEETPLNLATEDAVAQTLLVSGYPADKGTVTKSAECGNPVTLTAAPIPGWSFANWSGAIISSTNPIQVAFDHDAEVVANFTQDQYSLNKHMIGNGTVDHTPDKPNYLYGDPITLSAIPNPGWSFAGWSGDAGGSQSPLTLTMTSSKTVTATFTEDHYTVISATVGSGSLIVSPNQESYTYNSPITLVATPASGWSFAGWSGAITGMTNPLVINIVGNLSVSAIFTKDAYSLATITSGNGVVTRSPDQLTYDFGDQVVLTAASETGWQFEHWEDDISGTVNPTTVTMVGNLSVTAIFTKTRHTLTNATIGNGSLIITPQKEFYFYGEEITITAVPDRSWTLASWSGSATGNENPFTLVMDGNKSVIARFVEAPYELTTTISGQGQIKRSPDHQFFTDGATVKLTAEAAPGWRFESWSGGASGNGNPLVVTINGNTTISANFVQIGYTVTATVTSTLAGHDVSANSVTIAPDAANYQYGDAVTLTANTADGWNFAGWSGDLSGTERTKALTMTQDLSVTALFTPALFTLDYEVVGGQGGEGGRVTADPSGPSYTNGQVVTLTAEADEGYLFVEWVITDPQAAGATVSTPVLTVTIPDSRTFRARFVEAAEPGQIFLPLIVR